MRKSDTFYIDSEIFCIEIQKSASNFDLLSRNEKI